MAIQTKQRKVYFFPTFTKNRKSSIIFLGIVWPGIYLKHVTFLFGTKVECKQSQKNLSNCTTLALVYWTGKQCTTQASMYVVKEFRLMKFCWRSVVCSTCWAQPTLCAFWRIFFKSDLFLFVRFIGDDSSITYVDIGFACYLIFMQCDQNYYSMISMTNIALFHQC